MASPSNQIMSGNSITLDKDDPEERARAHRLLVRTKNEDLVDMTGVLQPVSKYL